jgi:hypothetical protein
LIDVIEELGHEIPPSARRSEWNVSGPTIIPSDDERWKEAQRQHHYEFYHSDEIAMRMLSVRPTTLTGAVALLEYATDHIDQGYLWPDDLSSIDEKHGDGREHERLGSTPEPQSSCFDRTADYLARHSARWLASAAPAISALPLRSNLANQEDEMKTAADQRALINCLRGWMIRPVFQGHL